MKVSQIISKEKEYVKKLFELDQLLEKTEDETIKGLIKEKKDSIEEERNAFLNENMHSDAEIENAKLWEKDY